MICDQCDGTGLTTKSNDIPKNFWVIKQTCLKCHGKKEIDWIEDIFGVDGDDYWIVFDPIQKTINVEVDLSKFVI